MEKACGSEAAHPGTSCLSEGWGAVLAAPLGGADDRM